MAIDRNELKRRLLLMIEAENDAFPDWPAVEAIAMALVNDLTDDDGCVCPTEIYRFIDDVDIRQRDKVYAAHQRDQLRRFLDNQA